MPPKVQVLLSTYNGAAYLREQVDSLLRHDYPNLHVLIRDDGSTDSTPGLLEEYSASQQVRILLSNNIGVVGSFFDLLGRVDADTEYVAFCDQDDVWLPGKVRRAVSLLQEALPEGTPGLYCSQYTVVDRDLNVLGSGPIAVRGPSFPNALVQNIAPGCSMVLNRPAIDLLAGRLPGAMVPVHDWWCYLVITALGKVVYDPESFLLYRQHGGNTIGEATGLYQKWSRRFRRFLTQSGRGVVTAQAREFERMYGHLLAPEQAAVLRRFLNCGSAVSSRLRYAVTGPVHRQSRVDDIILKCLIVANRV